MQQFADSSSMLDRLTGMGKVRQELYVTEEVVRKTLRRPGIVLANVVNDFQKVVPGTGGDDYLEHCLETSRRISSRAIPWPASN